MRFGNYKEKLPHIFKKKQKQHTEKEKDAEVDSSRERVSEKWQEKKTTWQVSWGKGDDVRW